MRNIKNDSTVWGLNNWKKEKELVAELCLILRDPIYYSLPGFFIHGIFQARILEWVAISFSRGSSWPRDQTQVSCIAGRFFTIWATTEAWRILEWVAIPFSRGSSQPRDRTQVSCIAGRFFTIWAPEKPKNTGVGSLSLPQRIFLAQESNWGILHCRQILYQLNYQGNDTLDIMKFSAFQTY